MENEPRPEEEQNEAQITPEWLEETFPELGIDNAGEVYVVYLAEGLETALGYLMTVAIETGIDEDEVVERFATL